MAAGPLAQNTTASGDQGAPTPNGADSATPIDPPPLKLRRYYGSVELNSTRVGRDAGKVADEVIAHLVGLIGSHVRVTLEIEAEMPEGAPEHVVRTVTENSRTLKFTSHGFESV